MHVLVNKKDQPIKEYVFSPGKYDEVYSFDDGKSIYFINLEETEKTKGQMVIDRFDFE